MFFATSHLEGWLWMIAISPLIIMGIRQGRQKMKDVKQGKIKGVEESDGFFDWMMHN